ncbi:MAG: GspE/PulE family protein [Mycobacteriales bacterium]
MRLGKSSKSEQVSEVNAPVQGAVALSQEPAVPGRARLGELLVRNEVLTHGQLAEALLQQDATGQRIGDLLVSRGTIDERQLADTLAAQFGLGLVDLRSVTPEPEAVALLSEAVARAHHAVPVRVLEDGTVCIAVADPSPANTDILRSAVGRTVALAIATTSEVQRAIENTYRALADVGDQVRAFEETAPTKRVDERTEIIADDAPVVQVVNKIITQALRDRASDVHIEPQGTQVRVRYRIDGALHEALHLPESMGPALVSRIKILGGMNIVERRKPQDGQIAMDVDGRQVDIRVSSTGTIWGEKVVLRLLDKSKKLYRVADLGMPPRTAEEFAKLVRSPYGMVVCVGPTGSGKTTTLYASMSELDDTDRNITTIEDPVEYVFPSINQIQINEAAGVTFAGGLRSILRQDPDVILVGEMRDEETARIAIQSALTGHFVLSSLHATDAVSALFRFLDMGIEPFLVGSSVLGIVGQRLLRRTCTYCAAPYTPSAEELAFFHEAGGRANKRKFLRGEGCNLCSQTGYSERIGVYELLRITEEVRQLIVAPNPSHHRLRELAEEQGMRTMRSEAIDLIDSDVTTIGEVIRTIYSL